MQQLTKFFEFDKREKEIHKKWDELKIYSYNKSHSGIYLHLG
jgi:hypothetical protein